MEEKTNGIIIYKNNEEGKLISNKNIFPDYEKEKDFSIIGRRIELCKIMDLINNNSEHNIIIIYGPKNIEKKNFVESLCFHLFERKIINNYTQVIEIEKELDILKIQNEIIKLKSIYKKNNKIVILNRISYSLNEKNSISLLNYILRNLELDVTNIYIIIILAVENKPNLDLNKNCEMIGLPKLNTTSSIILLDKILKNLGYEKQLCSDYENIFKIVKYDVKKLKEILIELIFDRLGDMNINKLEEIIKAKIKSEETEEKKEKELSNKKITKIYYLLSLMPSGISYSLIRLIFNEIIDIGRLIEEEDKQNRFIYQDNDNWYHINKKNKDNNIDDGTKEECITNCLKIYSRLLNFYIQNNQKDILFPDNNIHYIFNSFNGKGLWETLNEENKDSNKNEEQKKIKEYNYIISDDIDLEKHKDNILYLIEYNLKIISFLLKTNKKNFKEEYLGQILLMLPSCFFCKKNCISLINRSINICKELNLKNIENRLLLFLKSLENNPEIVPDIFPTLEFQAEAYFLKGLKYKEIASFEKVIELYGKINNHETININNIAYANYEISAIFFNKKEYKNAEKYLNKAKILSIKYKDEFLNNRCNIDLALILYKKFQEEGTIKNYKNELIEKINKVLMEVINQKIKMLKQEAIINNFKKEAYELKISLNQFFDSDITILSSNPLKNNYCLLSSGIFAYHNNNYYLLQKIYEKINLNIKINSKLLNADKYQYNLQEYLNRKGKILIIQSDDFSENGEIVLETKFGESILLTNQELEFLIPEKKIEYEVVILCFINSIKLKDIFKEKTQYLITFNEINYNELDSFSLLKYNELCINFLINFIIKTTELSIEDSFEASNSIFINDLKKSKKFKNKNQNFIELKSPDAKANKTLNYDIKKFKDKKKIFFYYPLMNLTQNSARTFKYSEEILQIIKKIYEKKERYIKINLDNFSEKEEKNPYKMNIKMKRISIELMKFLHRHQIFDHLFCIFNDKDKIKLLKEINNYKYHESILVLINNNNKIKFIQENSEDPLEEFDNIRYLIVNNREMEDKKRIKKNKRNLLTENTNINKLEKNLFEDFESIFTYKFKYDDD